MKSTCDGCNKVSLKHCSMASAQTDKGFKIVALCATCLIKNREA